MKAVLDTNVLLSGLMYPSSIPGRIVEAWVIGRFDLVISYAQLAEISRTLSYPKIRKITRWDDAKTDAFLRQLLLRAELVETQDTAVEVVADPTDTPILDSLVVSGAEALVTGDNDLLALREKYPIVTPAEFASRFS
jgi:putative PIN family toxin of toxin-antitoxin system